MKDLNIQKEIEQLKKISLTQDEKSKMLHNLSMYADLHMPVSSPFSIFSYFNTPLKRKLSFALASVMIAVLAGGPLAYASENSLPGDILYPIKTGVLEPVRIALARNPEKKALVETILANKRLEEAEKLEKLGRLTSDRKKYLDDKFESHVSNFNKITRDLDKESKKSERVQKDFDEKMNSHNEILNRFDRDLNGLKRLERRSTSSKENTSEKRLEDRRVIRDDIE